MKTIIGTIIYSLAYSIYFLWNFKSPKNEFVSYREYINNFEFTLDD